mgnify:CR=1 FL=1
MSDSQAKIQIKGAKAQNLKNISLSIPHHKLIAVTGISGSGKSSLAFDIIANEGRRRYLETIPSFARQYAGKLSRPDVDEIEGLFPVITVGQHKTHLSVQTTVGTLSDVYDHLRLLFARFGESKEAIKLSRSLFSFNRSIGACAHCNGLGTEERISKNKLISDPNKSLREGALVPSLPNGYIMYSQLTIDAMNMVCNAHDFNVDIPWSALTETQKEVIWYGSDRIKVPFGKHSIESRLKWTGMKAKPREESFYRGMIPVMEDILKRDRNKNILRFVDAIQCTSCDGKRLNKTALSVSYKGKSISDYASMSVARLEETLRNFTLSSKAESHIVNRLIEISERLNQLGLGHYHLSYPAKSLSGGEIQRIRLVNQLSTGLSNVLYVFDEPSVGLHLGDRQYLLKLFKTLVAGGNTVILVEHDPAMIKQTDWIIELGPGAGFQGGQLLYNGSTKAFLEGEIDSPTSYALRNSLQANTKAKAGKDVLISLDGFSNSLCVKQQALNVVCGSTVAGGYDLLQNIGKKIDSTLLWVDRSPIGRTPRSNPATYTGLADHIRDLFAKQEQSKIAGFSKSRFSFNNKGGRCETCEGAGKTQIGMHYMGQVELLCSACYGKRFNSATLDVLYSGKNIAEVYELRISEALGFFSSEKKIMTYLVQMEALGLSYLTLGQSSTSLSGGEAQRIKLASALAKKNQKAITFVLEEPTSGLHYQDTKQLITALRHINQLGHTVLCYEHQAQFILAADWIIEPVQDKLIQDVPANFIRSETPTAKLLLGDIPSEETYNNKLADHITILGANTHRLKHIDLKIPKNKLTVITGVSGSGKSSLAFHTLYTEAQARFSVSMSTYMRSFIKQSNTASALAFEHLTPTVAIDRKNLTENKRSTVATIIGLNEKYRFLFSRVAQQSGDQLSASNFSFNHESGACLECAGLGSITKALAENLLKDDHLKISEGAFTWHKRLAYYGNPDGQYIALLQKAASELGLDISLPIKDLSEEAYHLIFYGTGERVWETKWQFKNKTRSGEKEISGVWKGLCTLIEEEYAIKRKGKEAPAFAALMEDVTCRVCNGTRLKKSLLNYKIKDKNIAALSHMNALESLAFFEHIEKSSLAYKLMLGFYESLHAILKRMIALGLGHLNMSRSTKSLSGGEGQRLRLAAQFSTRLSGVTYVLDEPTIGLHPENIKQMLMVIDDLKLAGNTIVIVEHDKEVMLHADHIIEMGPGAGSNGGELIVQDSLKNFLSSKESMTVPYLKENKRPKKLAYDTIPKQFGLKSVCKYNLINRDFLFDAGGIIAVTGMSGSGKSTLIQKVLAPSLSNKRPINCKEVIGFNYFDDVVLVDQKALKANRKTSLAQHTGLLDLLQDVFSTSQEAKDKAYKKRHFSYANKESRCSYCKGEAQVHQAMDFMSDVWNVCPVCNGQRYNKEVLDFRLWDKNIADFLSMTINDLYLFLCGVDFKKKERILSLLERLKSLSLGHLSGSQGLSTLSGGEAQRIKLSNYLQFSEETEKYLFLLDEPSSGLHYKDLDVLIALFHKLVKAGHTVLFVEHNPYMIAVANQEVRL